MRHGHGTSSADVRLRWADDAVELEVANNGGPARDLERSPSDGRGIAGMRERASVHGASLTAEPRPGGGWRVCTRIPLHGESSVRA